MYDKSHDRDDAVEASLLLLLMLMNVDDLKGVRSKMNRNVLVSFVSMVGQRHCNYATTRLLAAIVDCHRCCPRLLVLLLRLHVLRLHVRRCLVHVLGTLKTTKTTTRMMLKSDVLGLYSLFQLDWKIDSLTSD